MRTENTFILPKFKINIQIVGEIIEKVYKNRGCLIKLFMSMHMHFLLFYILIIFF